MEVIGTYRGLAIVKGHLSGKPCIELRSAKGMANKEIPMRIFVHIGQKFKSINEHGIQFCMDSWGPEPAGWIIEFPSCYMTVDVVFVVVDGETPPYGLVRRLTEEHAITRAYNSATGHELTNETRGLANDHL